MNKFVLNTPVAFLIFNRPSTTKKVFEKIREARPNKLFIVADGPRKDKTGEEENCLAARKIVENIDWDCEVHKNYSDVNLGCKLRISSGIDWVFENTDEAIFLEDDCLPDQTFFQYCQELLQFYRDDPRIMMISGNNFQKDKTSEYSYYFSAYCHVWGWASWKRVWQKYDVEIKLWPEVKNKNLIESWLPRKKAVDHWIAEFDRAYMKKVDTWDFQFLFTCWINNGLSILPEVNLVSNIGFGVEATNTTGTSNRSANIPYSSITFPLKHPPYIIRNLEADKYEEDNYTLYSFLGRMKRKILRVNR